MKSRLSSKNANLWLPLATAVVGMAVTVSLDEKRKDIGLVLTVLIVVIEIVIALFQEMSELDTSISERIGRLESNQSLVQLAGIDKDDPIVRYRAKGMIERLVTDTNALASKDFVVTTEVDVDLRREILLQISDSFFATWVETIVGEQWEGSKWLSYRQQCYDTAKTVPFDRVFVLNGPQDFTPVVEDLVREHVREGVNTYIAYKGDLENLGLDPNHDFALFDGDWLATLTLFEGEYRVRYQRSEEVVERCRLDVKRILTASTSAEEFLASIRVPLNLPEEIDTLGSFQSMLETVIRSNDEISALIRDVTTGRRRICVVGSCLPVLDQLASLGSDVHIEVFDTTDADRGLKERYGAFSFNTIDALSRADNQQAYDACLLIGLSNSLKPWQLRDFFLELDHVVDAKSRIVLFGMIPPEQFLASQPGLNDVPMEFDAIASIRGHLDTLDKTLRLLHSERFYDPVTGLIDLQPPNSGRTGQDSPDSHYSLTFSTVPLNHIRDRIDGLFDSSDERLRLDELAPWFRAVNLTRRPDDQRG